MGDAADDAYDSALRQADTLGRMRLAGCKPCPNLPHEGSKECPICFDLNWVDKDGNPCEP